MESINKRINSLINPDIGKTFELTEQDNAFIEEYQKGISSLSEEDRLLTFANVIRREGRCEFASGGTFDYLVNTNKRNRYRITIRTLWHSGINYGQSDQIVYNEPGGRLSLGCTDSGYIPITYFMRRVVGELKLSAP